MTEKLFLQEKNELTAINQACLLLRHGGVIVYPTDTLYALGADVANEEGIRRLFMIKKRPETKPLPLFVDSTAMAKKYAFIDERRERILKKIWPGAVTVILKKKDSVSNAVSGGRQTVGLRMPDSPFCLHLVHALGGPVTGTSANISGEAGSNELDPILRQFKMHSRFPDLIIDAGMLPSAQPSTIIDLTDSKPKILRIGPVSAEKLREILAL